MINFLEAAVVFLLVTNVFSVFLATCAVRLLMQYASVTQEPTSIERRLNAILGLSA
jgi:hypothetical protein